MSVTLTQFTDPFCTWCWGAEPLLRRVEETYGDQVDVEFVMGGLIDDFESFVDRANGITEPADVAPHWEEAAQRHGMPVDTSVWYTNPPRSSYPACMAYEAAEFQGTELAHRYLRRLREALAVGGQNIGDREVLVDLAGEVGLGIERFRAALSDGRARAAFEEDRNYTREAGATAFPTFRVAGEADELLLRGFQPFVAVADALETVTPDIERREPRPLASFVEQYGPVATREVAEVYQVDDEEARQRLTELVADGSIEERELATGSLWTATTNEQPR